MLSIEDKKWQDFYLMDFFRCEKGNQNNMSALSSGSIPLVSARKCDNGYKDFVAPNHKSLFDGGILTLNNDGDGGAGIAYYQPHKMALDSHVTALIPKLKLSRFQLLFIAMCITKQRNRFGHGYSLNSNRLRSFKLMLPTAQSGLPDWQFMEEYMRLKERELLKPTIDKLCKQLITNDLTGGVNRFTLIGKHSILQRYSLKFNVVRDLKRQTTKLEILRMYHQHHSTMGLMDSSAMMAA